MRTDDCFKELWARHRDELVVTNGGALSSLWYTTTGSDEAFYMRSSMGLASSIALGLAVAVPQRRVWLFEGDGALSMNLGNLITTATRRPANLTFFVVVDRLYRSSGGQTIAGQVDFVEVARGVGFERTVRFNTLDDFRRGIGPWLDEPGLSLVCLEVEPVRDPYPDIPYDPVEMKYRFARHLERNTGMRVFP